MKTLCKSVHITRRDNVKGFAVAGWILHDQTKVYTITADKAITLTETDTAENGMVTRAQSLQIDLFDSSNIQPLLNNYIYYVCKVQTIDGVVYVGSVEYPAIKQITSSATSQLTFNAVKPA